MNDSHCVLLFDYINNIEKEMDYAELRIGEIFYIIYVCM